MDIILSIARLLFLLTGYFFRGGYQLVLGCLVLIIGMFICGGSVFIAAKGVPLVTEALGYGRKTPAEAASAAADAAATLTAKPPTATVAPTATVEPAESAWPKVAAQLDAVWAKDWEVTIGLLKGFLNKYSNHTEARQKLFAALVSSSTDLLAGNRRADAVARLREAETMFPNKEAKAKLAELGELNAPTAAQSPVAAQTSYFVSTPTPVPAIGTTVDISGRWLLPGGTVQLMAQQNGAEVEIRRVQRLVCFGDGVADEDPKRPGIGIDHFGHEQKGEPASLFFRGKRDGDNLTGITLVCNNKTSIWDESEAKIRIDKNGTNMYMNYYAGTSLAVETMFRPPKL